MYIDSVIVTPLLKAFKKFESFRQHQVTEQKQAGAILAFEYTFELVWKVMQRLLKERGKIANSPRETFRMAVLEGFIDDPETWFDFLKKRNLTEHTYEIDDAQEVLGILPEFSLHVRKFLQVIGVPESEYVVIDIK